MQDRLNLNIACKAFLYARLIDHMLCSSVCKAILHVLVRYPQHPLTSTLTPNSNLTLPNLEP